MPEKTTVMWDSKPRSRTLGLHAVKKVEVSVNSSTAMAQHLYMIAGPTISNLNKLPFQKWGELSEKTKASWRAIGAAAIVKGACL